MSEITYRGYTLTTEQVGRENDPVFDGLAICPGSEHAELVAVSHPSPEAAIIQLKRNIDFWLAPNWTRNLDKANKRIKELEEICRELGYYIGCMANEDLAMIEDMMGDPMPIQRLMVVYKEIEKETMRENE